MIASLSFCGRPRSFDLSRGTSLAIPLAPGQPQPLFFTDQPATYERLSIGSFRGDVSEGGSCNAGFIRMAPHCHGTHTESCGHLTEDACSIQSVQAGGLLTAWLVSVQPVPGRLADEHYASELGESEGLITTGMLHLDQARGCQALIIRTLPNPDSKRWHNYLESPAYPVLSLQAAQSLVDAGIEHLLIDTPSVDRADDGGRLAIHRIFWGMEESGRVPSSARQACTITEMIFVNNDLAEGPGLLSQGISPLVGEASPSAPVFFPEVR